MLNRKVKAILFMFLILIFISAANAESADNNTYVHSADIINMKSEAVEIAVADVSADTGNFSDLNRTINGKTDDSIDLEKNYTYSSESDKKFEKGIIISRNLTINGNGHTIDGNHGARIFNITNNATLTLKNVNLINGNATYGGAVNIQKGTLKVVNTTFINNTATISGGAIFSSMDNVVIMVDNSTFIYNSAGRNGGAIGYDSTNYRITSTIIVNNSKFFNNKAKDLGGAICNYMQGSSNIMIISNSQFINNSAKSGGAIINSLPSTSSNNKGYTHVINSTFINNTANSAGAIYAYKNDLNITNSKFINNTANSSGAISFQSDNLIINNSTFTNNQAKKYVGGAIYCQMPGSHFMNIYITESTFTNNTSMDDGGAICQYSGMVNSNSTMVIVNSTFVNNNAINGSGGAILNSIERGSLTVINSKFINNTANYFGAIEYSAAGNTNSKLFINNSLFDSNSARNRGGVLSVEVKENVIENSNFTNNRANEEIGVIEVTMGNLVISNSIFENNTAGINAGTMFIEEGNVTIVNSTFKNNKAELLGGAIENDGNLTIINSSFMENNAFMGGALVNEEEGMLTIVNSTFNENKAQNNGGSILSFSDLNITNSVFNENNAVNGGSVYAVGNATIINSKFTANNATNGGAIYFMDFYNFYLEYLKATYQFYFGEEIPEELLKEFEEGLKEYAWEYDGLLKIKDSVFDENSGKLGDDIYTGYNTTVSGNSYTKNSYANIYANNTIINFTVVTVLDNSTYEVLPGIYFKINGTVFADGASVAGYELVITDGTNKYKATYVGYGKYELIEGILTNFQTKSFGAILNGAEDFLNYEVRNGTLITKKQNLEIEIELDETVSGENITGNITLRDENGNIANVTGEITIEIDGKNYTANVSEGKGKFNIEDEFGPGNHTLNAYFEGNDQYNPSNTTVDFTIVDDGIILEVDNLTKYYGSDKKLIIVLTDKQGNPLANQLVTITINGITYTRMTDAEGRILMNINLIPGIYESTVSYGNISKNVTISILSTIEAEDLVKYFKNGSQYYAKFYNIDGTPLANTNVTFNIHGVFYTRTTDENGIAKLNINLNPGEYIITAWNPANNETKANVITVLSTIFGENVVKFYRNGTHYYAYVLDLDGTPLKNQNVTFNIHGVFYNRTTDENGIVKLNINLNPGKYIITAWNLVNGEATSNNITVYNVVKSQDLEMTTSARKPFTVTILGDHGEPLANANVTFNIHGVFYHKTTDANGQISLNINLVAGKYIITTYYNEYSISNTIVVK